MDNSGSSDLLTAFKKLVAENKSQQSRLEEYTAIIRSRDNEIEMLQSMLSEANEQRSSTDNQLTELKELQRFLGNLQQQVSGNTYYSAGNQQQTGNPVSAEQQLEALQQAHAQLKAQLSDLQTQLLDMNNRNLLLQQQAGRIAELESLVANFEFERDNIGPGNTSAI